MNVQELITTLQTMNPNAKVVVMTSHDEGNDVTDWNIKVVHDHWNINAEHDLVSVEIDLDQRPGWLDTLPRIRVDLLRDVTRPAREIKHLTVFNVVRDADTTVIQCTLDE